MSRGSFISMVDDLQSSPVPSPDELLEAVRQAGWLLEQDAWSELTAFGFVSQPSFAFPDPDEPSTSREIDVMGLRNLIEDDRARVRVQMRVLMECKQSSMPYVLIGRPTASYRDDPGRPEFSPSFPRVMVSQDDAAAGAKKKYVSAAEYLRLRDLPYSPWADDFVANQMTRLERRSNKWMASNEGIFSSLVHPLAKANEYFRKQRSSRPIVLRSGQRSWSTVEFRQLVVVTSAPVFKLDAGSSSPRPEQVDWSTVTRQLSSDNVTGTFHIDVVHAPSLATYLTRRVDAFGNAIRSIDPERFVTSQDTNWQ